MIRRNWFPLLVTAAILYFGPSAARKVGDGEGGAVRPAAMAAPALDPGARLAGADAGACEPGHDGRDVTCPTPEEIRSTLADL